MAILHDGSGYQAVSKKSSSGGRKGSPSAGVINNPSSPGYISPEAYHAMRQQGQLERFLQAVWQPSSGGGGTGYSYSSGGGGGGYRRGGGGGGGGAALAALKARAATAKGDIKSAYDALDARINALNSGPQPMAPTVETWNVDPRMFNDLRLQGADASGLRALDQAQQQMVGQRNAAAQNFYAILMAALQRSMQDRLSTSAQARAAAEAELANNRLRMGV